MKPCTFLDVDNCGNVDMKPVSTRVNWSGASRGLRTKGRTASIHCRPAPPRQTEALSSRTSRQPVFGSAVQDAQVPAGVPGPLRLDPERAGPRPGILRLAHHHSGLGLLPPHDAHFGLAEQRVAERAGVLAAADVAHPAWSRAR